MDHLLLFLPSPNILTLLLIPVFTLFFMIISHDSLRINKSERVYEEFLQFQNQLDEKGKVFLTYKTYYSFKEIGCFDGLKVKLDQDKVIVEKQT